MAAFLLPKSTCQRLKYRPTTKGAEVKKQLADSLPVEREWDDVQEAQLAALRVILGLPRRPVLLNKEETP